MKIFLKSVVLVTVLLSAALAIAETNGVDGASLYVLTERVSWKGAQPGLHSVEDDGLLGGLGVKYSTRAARNRLRLSAKAEFIGGEVGSSGMTDDGFPLPTRATWYGFRLESDAGIPLLPGNHTWSIVPLAGLGYRWWVRDLHDSTTSNGYTAIFVPGRGETWQSFYGYLGGRAGVSFSSQSKLSVEFSARHPFLNRDRAELPTGGATMSEPDGTWTFRTGIEYVRKGLVSELYYETFRYRQGEVVGAEDISADILGFSFGVHF